MYYAHSHIMFLMVQQFSRKGKKYIENYKRLYCLKIIISMQHMTLIKTCGLGRMGWGGHYLNKHDC